MALKSFVDDARKTNKLIELKALEKKGSEAGIIDISNGQSIPQEKLEELRNGFSGQGMSRFSQKPIISRTGPKTDFEREYLQKQRFQQNSIEERAMSLPVNNGNKQQIDERHGNIIADVIKSSGNCYGQRTTWEKCRHVKVDGPNTYCKEFHSLCGKERCKRATQ
jgi:hypothetical protein